MDSKQIFQKFYSRLATEGMLKALLCGVAVGCGAAFITSFILWFTSAKLFWIAIVIAAALIAATTPVFYFRFFKPTTKTVAHRVDRLGLAERLITMTELENDSSYIAMRQREDAKAALSAVGESRIGLVVPRWIIAVAAALFAVATFMVIFNGLSDYGIAPKALGPNGLIDDKGTTYYTVTFVAGSNGYLEGAEEQVVAQGEDAEAVYALPDDGYAFVGWTDDEFTIWLVEDPERAKRYEDPHDPIIYSDNYELIYEQVLEDVKLTALFVEITDDDDPNGEPGDEQGEPGDEQGAPDAGGPEGQPGEQGNDGPPPPPSAEQPNPGEDNNNGNGAGSGDPTQNETFIDGEKELKDYYDEYYQKAMQMLAEGKDIPDDLRSIVEGYFNILLP